MPDISATVRAALTVEQANAALDPASEILGLACAGSGKSTTLAHRIAYLIAGGVDPQTIVAITFTEKAAEEIKRKIAKVLIKTSQDPNLIGQMFVGTIHGFCQNVLSESDALYRQYDVLDENKFTLFLMSRYFELYIKDLKPRFRNKYFDTIKGVKSAWNIAMDEGLSIGNILASDLELGQALQAIQHCLQRDQFLDFASMVRLVADGAHQPGAIRERLASIQHLLVDEYQDVSGSQEEVIQEIHKLGAKIFVVGDDDQSIYSFRGAHVNNILTFSARYPSASTHVLDTNFRSTRAIVDSSSDFVAQELGAQRLPKTPHAHADLYPRHFGVHFFASRADEADWVARRIELLLGTKYVEKNGQIRGLTPADFAILMRSTRTKEASQVPRHHAFTERLENSGIPFTLAAGGSVFDSPHVCALRDAFRLLAPGNPDRPAVIDLFRNSVLPAFPSASQSEFIRVMSSWGRNIHIPSGGTRVRLFPQNLVLELLESFGIKRNMPSDDIMRNLGLFSKMIQDVESIYPSVDSAYRFQSIRDFLDNVAASGYDVSTEDITNRPDAVTVTTVHKMKGLEFPVVFVVDAVSRRFPKDASQYDGMIQPALISHVLANGAYQDTIQAEARLFYTALTRAERFLYVSGCQQMPGGKQAKSPSVFVRRLQDPEIEVDPLVAPTGLSPVVQVRRDDDASLPTSFSDIHYYLKCPMDYRFRKGYGFSPAVNELFGYGRVVHVAVEKLHELYPSVAPSPAEAVQVVRNNFQLKHIFPSKDPVNRPGAYERAKEKAEGIAASYVQDYSDDFTHRRQVEARFEIPAKDCLITGSIDLMVHLDAQGGVIDTQVMDFKTMEGGSDPLKNPKLDWTAFSLQVQLYAKAAHDVLGENANSGAIHLLKDNVRVNIPVDPMALDAARDAIEWAVAGILAGDFPMRPEAVKCSKCDFRQICPQTLKTFSPGAVPPPKVYTPDGPMDFPCA